MSRMIIVEGDLTSGGGRVVTGSHETSINGLGVARVTDTCTCPSHKGTFPIVTGDMTFIVDGQPVARHGDKLACGCSLLSTRQFRVFLDDMTSGTGSARSSVSAAVTIAVTAGGNVGSESESANLSHVHSDRGHSSPSDPAKARAVVSAVNDALLEADAFRVYDTELEAAQAWSTVAEPVANSPEHGVEVGANISEINGKYVLGTAYSIGSESNCDGLIEKGPRVVGGQHTAYIHTHPVAYGGTGRNRAYSLGEAYDPDFGDATHGRPASGWDIGPGDYDVAYNERLNAYIAEPGAVVKWDYQKYLELQKRASADMTLGDTAVELIDAETRH